MHGTDKGQELVLCPNVNKGWHISLISTCSHGNNEWAVSPSPVGTQIKVHSDKEGEMKEGLQFAVKGKSEGSLSSQQTQTQHYISSYFGKVTAKKSIKVMRLAHSK